MAKPNLVQHDPEEGRRPFNLRMLTEKHNGENLTITILIVGVGLIAYYFLQKINGISIIQNRWFRGKCTGTNFDVSRVTYQGAEERKRHDLALEKLQKARYEWNRNRMKCLDLINKSKG